MVISSGGVKPYKLYSENELLEVIRPLAERWADFTEKEGG